MEKIETIKFGQLMMEDKIVPVPQNPVYNGDIFSYKRGTELTLVNATEGDNLLTWVKVSDDLLVCDRCMINYISYEKLLKVMNKSVVTIDDQTYHMHILNTEEWEQLCDLTEDDNIIHWHDIGTITSSQSLSGLRKLCGYSSARAIGGNSTYSDSHVGFRPALKLLNTEDKNKATVPVTERIKKR